MTKTNSKGFQYPSKTFPSVSTVWLTEGIFLGPQIREIVEDEAFAENRTDTERAAWESSKWVCSNFWGSKNSPDFGDGIQKLLNAYKEMGCRMALKLHCLHSPLDFFPETLGEASDEQGERCQHDIKSTEHQYQGFWNDTMI